ncbi:NAD(P)H-dependent glycerol-3-phosphate dehydrogenase [Lichenicola cladoniae]|uniref:Glycerol-3-phosphate dehydrogenase [NAD(P)+] n=1 Tax=Lichenicola cladoniae TaxID=1484109 RepID=A0A6M8HQK7_9PROT|nr:NAD(P)H-dependent glycerol-3-phosphate dehydrogenase [Lichenicola cladoniae]NPD68154.1 NAD(P)H-dependent glycerol-3-phosphate dehydrogenase [Acetobacteraceae bacterium]QKE90724.1 NAD(P)H-dependent glycerol-3-phosphate dehydrogenase [Lichenicola cladoniae]
MTPRIAVIGAGAWGTALALQAARAGATVSLWARDPGALQPDGCMRRLPGLMLPHKIEVTGTLPTRADLVLLAVPMQQLRRIAGQLTLEAPLIACCKGVESGTLCLPGEVLADLHPGLPRGMLSGPNFAGEVARALPAASVLACSDAALAGRLARMLATASFRVYAGDDPVGVEAGGAAKNVIAIAAGAAMGSGAGENARAALITRGIAELGRLIAALGGKPATAAGLSGVGDLVLTCTGPGSRNYSLGVALGEGIVLQDILAGRSTVAEGVETAPALAARAASMGVSVPIIEAVAALLTGRIGLAEARERLLARPLGIE